MGIRACFRIFFPSSTYAWIGADRITSSKASREFADKINENCTFKIWDNFYHEIHNEPEKEEVFKFFIDWLDKQV